MPSNQNEIRMKSAGHQALALRALGGHRRHRRSGEDLWGKNYTFGGWESQKDYEEP